MTLQYFCVGFASLITTKIYLAAVQLYVPFESFSARHLSSNGSYYNGKLNNAKTTNSFAIGCNVFYNISHYKLKLIPKYIKCYIVTYD